MNVLMVIFSQTGNTVKFAESISNSFSSQGHNVYLVTLNQFKPELLSSCQLIGVGSPCFNSQAPTPAKIFLRGLPLLKGKQAFVFATSGGAPGKVLFDMSLLLRRKGADVIAGLHTRGEVAYPAPALKGRFPGRPNQEDLRIGAAFAHYIMKKILHPANDDLIREFESHKFAWNFYSLMAYLITDGVIRLLMPKPNHLAQRCQKHGICQINCPMAAITLKPYPSVNQSRCIRCFRCVNTCPELARLLQWGWADWLIALVYNVPMERILGAIKPGDTVY
ncbi:MAG: EFR1 family ferrodoxin [Clostridia bacterium]|nr:EFR1 family ferrodoxin [Clostridia bacterium]